MEDTRPEEELPPEYPKPRWFHLMKFFSFLFIGMGCGMLCGYLANFISVQTIGLNLFDTQEIITSLQEGRNTVVILLLLSLSSQVAFLLACIIYPLFQRENPIEFLNITEKPKLFFLGVAFLLFLLIQPLLLSMVSYFNGIGLPGDMKEVEDIIKASKRLSEELQFAMLGAPGFGNFILATLIIAILPAITEELFFRKVCLKLLYDVSNNAAVSIFISAFLFTVIHGNPYNFVPILMMGILLGYLALWTGNIWVPIIAHFTNNFFALCMYKFSKMYPDAVIFSEEYEFPGIWIILSAVLSIAIIYYIRKKGSEQEETTPDGERLD